jgi:hypothetical protein
VVLHVWPVGQSAVVAQVIAVFTVQTGLRTIWV